MKKLIPISSLMAFIAVGFTTLFTAGSAASVEATQYPYPPPQTVTPPIVSPLPPLPISTDMAPIPTPLPTEAPSPAQSALDFIANNEGIPSASLIVTTDHSTEYPNLERKFQVVTLLDTRPKGHFYKLLVDLNTGEVIQDVTSIVMAEEQAQAQKYGKLEPDLYDRLQTIRDTDLITVTLLVAAEPGQSMTEIEAMTIAALTAKYPEARVAVEQGGKPVDVDDSTLAKRIYTDYVSILDSAIAQRVQPIVKILEAEGIEVYISAGLPVITASLTRKAILQLQERADVVKIFLADSREIHLPLNSAVPSDRVPTVWSHGYNGAGVKVAILETDNVDFNSPGGTGSQCPAGDNCLPNNGGTQGGYQGVQNHATLVGSIVGSNHTTYKGVAPGSTILSAGLAGSTDQDFINALNWALTTKGSDVVNASVSVCTGTLMTDHLDWAFDYYARYKFRLIVVAAGDISLCAGSPYVTTPAKGWNVLAVGSYDDKNDSNWSNDSMDTDSSWKDPSTANDDHEKPEVVAPGVSISGIAMDANIVTGSGTSFAAPQVSGLAALLIQRNSSLRYWQESLRAIIMASAIHNIEGPSTIPSDMPSQDLKDGAGGIDAALADLAASNGTTLFSNMTPCNAPCWWGLIITNSNFPSGSYLDRYFKASRGEHIRVAIAWDSATDCVSQSSCSYDRLDTDLDLSIYDPDGYFVPSAYSTSWDNGYELVEFTAPKTGQYTIGIYRSGNEATNYLGIAWVKDATYLPDLRNKDGFVSEFYVRNDGAVGRNVRINYFDTNGNNTPVLNGYDVCSLAPNQRCRILVSDPCCNRIPAGTIGSAIVDGGEDVSVVVTQKHTSPEAWAAYTAVRQPTTQVHIPLLHKNNGGYYSEVYIQNIGTSSTNVTIFYYASPGYLGSNCSETYSNIPAQGLQVINLSNVGCVGLTFIGSAFITSSANNPLAVASTQRKTDNSSMAENTGAGTATLAYAPLIQNNNFGWTAGVALQNASSNTNNLTAATYNQGGTSCRTDTYTSIATRVSQIIGVPGANCTIIASAVYNGGSLPVAAIVNQVKSGTPLFADYEAIHAPSTYVVVPLWKNQPGTWISALVVQNTTNQVATITLTYYDSSGSQYGAPVPQILQSRQIYVTSSAGAGVPDGSLVVTATQPIAVITDQSLSISGDGIMSYSGVHR